MSMMPSTNNQANGMMTVRAAMAAAADGGGDDY